MPSPILTCRRSWWSFSFSEMLLARRIRSCSSSSTIICGRQMLLHYSSLLLLKPLKVQPPWASLLLNSKFMVQWCRQNWLVNVLFDMTLVLLCFSNNILFILWIIMGYQKNGQRYFLLWWCTCWGSFATPYSITLQLLHLKPEAWWLAYSHLPKVGH